MCSATWAGPTKGKKYFILCKYQAGPFPTKSEKRELKV